MAIGGYSINGYLWLFHYKPLVVIDGYYMLYYEYWRLFYRTDICFRQKKIKYSAGKKFQDII